VALIIVGAGGHGKVVLDAARLSNHEVACFIDRRPQTSPLSDTPVYDSLAAATQDAGLDALTHFIVAVGDNYQRAEEFAVFCAAGLRPRTVQHPAAIVSPRAHIGRGSYLGAGAVVNPDAHIGDNVIVNTSAIVEHDCRVADHAFIAPGAVMCGQTAVGRHTLLGAHATLVPTVKLGADSLVAAGAVVTRSWPDDSRLFGVPARLQDPLEHHHE
jgi:acetyltransferase EpsM